MKKQSRNSAFIDSQNLNLAIRSLGWRLDFTKFRVYLREKYGVGKAFLFIGFIAGNEQLYDNLKKAGYTVVFKPTLERKEEGEMITKGNVDAELVLHAMIEYNHFHQAVIITGDGDFYCLVDYLNKHNKLARLLIPNAHRYSSLLKPFAPNKIDFMNNLKGKLEYRASAGEGVKKVKQEKAQKPTAQKKSPQSKGRSRRRRNRGNINRRGNKKGRQLHKDQPL